MASQAKLDLDPCLHKLGDFRPRVHSHRALVFFSLVLCKFGIIIQSAIKDFGNLVYGKYLLLS